MQTPPLRHLRHLRLAATIGLVVLSTAGSATAQQFGRNQVRHQSFQFKVLRTEHFAIYYNTDVPDAARMAGRMAERWYVRLSEVMAHPLRGEQPLILYAAPGHFQQTNVIDSEIGEGVGGFIESNRRRIVMPLVGDLGETDHVLGHEVVHAFQFDMIGPRWPLWFMEGMAEYLSLGSVDAHTAVWMRDAALADRLPTISDLNNPRFFPYRYGQALFAYIGQRYGDSAIPAIMRRLGAPALRPLQGAPAQNQNGALRVDTVSDPIRAIELAVGVDRATLSREWHESIRATMLPGKGNAGQPGDTLITPRNDRETNVGPVLSPDGSRVAFLTSRNLLSLDLVVADANTGRIQRTLLRTISDPHLDSLQFITSAGTWDPSGQRVAMAVMRRGRPVLAVVNADTGRRERDIPLRDLDEAVQPSWSPDGMQIAFSGLRNGMSDLYVVAVADGAIRRLTEDAFAERQPAWSPDGRSLVFVTDRFSSAIDVLHLGAHDMARIDVSTREVTRLSGFAAAQHGSPQWTAHGIYFVANPDGVPDVYRLDPATGDTTRITRSSTGVTGITSGSPALSVARTEQRLAFSLQRTNYEIRQLKGSALTAGGPVPSQTTLAAARLAPASGLTSVDRLLANATQGLPAEAVAESVPFRPRLSLDFIGQEFNVSTGGTGPFLSGGIGFVFSDVLGDHRVEGLVQTNSEFRDTAGRIGYLNRRQRWNWGGFYQFVPVVTGGISRGTSQINGQPVLIEQEVRDRQVGQQVQGILEFPISRSQRFEFGAGLSHFTFNRRIRTSVFSQSGALVAQDEQHIEIADPLTLWQTMAAFVTDSAVFGATGPLMGYRSRFEVAPTLGDIDYTSVVLDARRYLMPVEPFTIAVRAVHVGRYGGDADSGRLSPLFVGFPTFVRGYDIYSFHAHDCDPGSCIQLDDLEGSRMLVGNLEVRAPLVGMFKGRIEYGHLPVDVIGFFDTGVAWRGSDIPSASFSDRPWVKSAGAGARINAFGFAVVELSAVHAFDRPRDKWQFLFALQPGF